MVEPLSVAWHAVKRSAFTPGAKCLVMGSGPVRTHLLWLIYPPLMASHRLASWSSRSFSTLVPLRALSDKC